MKNSKKWIIVIILIIVLILAIFICKTFLFKEETLTTVSQNIEKREYKLADINEVNINEIINSNTQKIIKEELITEEIDLEYTTIYKNNEELEKGKIQVLQEGRDGKQNVITKRIYEGESLIKEEEIASTVIKSSIDKIIEVGTGNYKSNYKVQKGDKLYVTSYTLNVMQEKDKNSNKITTLQKDDEVKLLEISNEWYKISYKSYNGWVDQNCLAYKTQTSETNGEQQSLSKKEQLISKLSQTMKLNSPSGLSLEQFKTVLSNNENDKNKIFEKNAEYFYYIEKQYNINGVFVAAVGIHESNWGSSSISLNKRNLFGYGANDSSPYSNAYNFSNYSEGIDLISRVFVKYYLNASGTKIYDNEVASGKYYSGSTLADVNKKYATDKNWNNAVYKWMSYLYNKL